MSGFRTLDGLQGLAAIHARDDSGLLSISAGRIRTAAGVTTFFSAMSATAAPLLVRGYGNSSSTVEIATPNATATVTGGVAPFTYEWTRTDGGGHDWAIISDISATTAFTSEVDAGATQTATFACTVTDSLGAEAVTNEITAAAVNLGGGL